MSLDPAKLEGIPSSSRTYTIIKASCTPIAIRMVSAHARTPGDINHEGFPRLSLLVGMGEWVVWRLRHGPHEGASRASRCRLKFDWHYHSERESNLTSFIMFLAQPAPLNICQLRRSFCTQFSNMAKRTFVLNVRAHQHHFEGGSASRKCTRLSRKRDHRTLFFKQGSRPCLNKHINSKTSFQHRINYRMLVILIYPTSDKFIQHPIKKYPTSDKFIGCWIKNYPMLDK